jgi:hypothetical protein
MYRAELEQYVKKLVTNLGRSSLKTQENFVEVCSNSSRDELFASFWEITRARQVSSFYPELANCSCHLFTLQVVGKIFKTKK